MTQPGFFDLDHRYASLDAKNDPLVALKRLIPWESFRPLLRAAFEQSGIRATAETRKSTAGRKPWDELLIFQVIVLQTRYNLGDTGQGQYGLRRLGRQCLSVGGDGGALGGARHAQPHPPQRDARASVVGEGEEGKQNPLVRAGPGGACFRRLRHRDGRQAGAHDRHCQGTDQDRVEEPRL